VSDPITRYRVVYSERVQQRLATMGGEAAERGDREAFAAALKAFDDRLHVYPQFGDPLSDLTHEKATLYNGIIRPLAMRYAIYEGLRLVIVVGLPVLLPQASSEEPDSDQ
jgi:hypothetical protein